MFTKLAVTYVLYRKERIRLKNINSNYPQASEDLKKVKRFTLQNLLPTAVFAPVSYADVKLSRASESRLCNVRVVVWVKSDEVEVTSVVKKSESPLNQLERKWTKMVMALDGLTRLCPLILFDWRLYAERGCPRFFHTHSDAKRTDDCELGFLKQVNRIPFLLSHIEI
ncbi:uncharacterized protein TNIN_355541 [Trichonephila inaurata madagascariensis]|uniref:Uncharacterized protein n=1 Tax=Trichonephila inaurata madagascariensis TaxID=2747483 RepID=A0A8X6X3U9_9ARAC|nr:uncharacterized protein TNIN_355541 [Trichonephila inaurata madagascariensis]